MSNLLHCIINKHESTSMISSLISSLCTFRSVKTCIMQKSYVQGKLKEVKVVINGKLSDSDLNTLITRTSCHSSSVVIVRNIVNQIFVFCGNFTSYKHDFSTPQTTSSSFFVFQLLPVSCETLKTLDGG